MFIFKIENRLILFHVLRFMKTISTFSSISAVDIWLSYWKGVMVCLLQAVYIGTKAPSSIYNNLCGLRSLSKVCGNIFAGGNRQLLKPGFYLVA